MQGDIAMARKKGFLIVGIILIPAALFLLLAGLYYLFCGSVVMALIICVEGIAFAAIAAGNIFSALSKAPETPAARTCPVCKAEINGNGPFCVFCGTALNQDNH